MSNEPKVNKKNSIVALEFPKNLWHILFLLTIVEQAKETLLGIEICREKKFCTLGPFLITILDT